MNKRHWIAAGLIALSASAASAATQPSVHFEGTLDAGFYQDLAGVRGIGSINPSNIAVSGTEPLGNGSEFIFRLSARFRMQDGR